VLEKVCLITYNFIKLVHY